MPVGPTPEIVNRTLDLLETRLVGEIETRQGEFDEGPITHLVGSWYLSAIHSQLVHLDDSDLLTGRVELRFRFPFVTGEEPERQLLEAMAHRFVVAEVLTGATDRLRVLSWQIVGELVEEDLLNEECGLGGGELLAGGRHVGDGDHLDRFRELSLERLEVGEGELSSDYGEYLRLIREAFLGWLRAFRGVSVEALGEFEYLWREPRHLLASLYRSAGEPYDLGDDEPE
jgi:hypothetical protein